MSSSEVEHRNIAHSIEQSIQASDVNYQDSLDVAERPRRKSVENLVISSQDAIGQSISQALTFSGVITQHTPQPTSQENRNVSRSPSPCRHLLEPAITEAIEFEKNEASLYMPSSAAGDAISISSQMDSLSPSTRGSDGTTKLSTSPGQNSKGPDGVRSKKKSWYSSLYPTYKSRSEDFKRLFKDIPDEERLIVDYSCALQKDILAHGRLYVSLNYLCFYANIFGWETCMALRWKDVTSITKEKTALVIPNAILVCTESEKNFLTSFSGRDKAYLMLFRVWQNALMDQQMTSQEIWTWVHSCYGEELGFNSDDEDYARDIPDEDKLATVRLSAESISEDYGETSSMDAGPAGVDERGEDAGGTLRPHYGRSVSQPPESSARVGGGENGYNGEENGDTLPTDMSDTSDSEPDKPSSGMTAALCTENHDGLLQLQMEVPVNIDQLFTMMFTSSKFNLELLASRNTSDYIQSPWKHDAETGLKCRQVSYTMALSQPIGPKVVYVTETQVMKKGSKPGVLYSIDASSENAGIPYADSFYVVVHFCLRKRAERLTSLQLFSHIKYKKSVWGLVKGFIEKNTFAGLDDFARILENKLLQEVDSNAPAKRKGRRRRRITSSSQETSPPCVSKSPAPSATLASSARPSLARAGPWDAAPAPSASPWLLGILLLLVLINALLYWRLYYTEPRPYVLEMADFEDRISEMSTEQKADWAKLLEQHSHSTRDELRAWRDALDTAIQTLKQTEQALRNVLDAIRPAVNRASEEPVPHIEL